MNSIIWKPFNKKNILFSDYSSINTSERLKILSLKSKKIKYNGKDIFNQLLNKKLENNWKLFNKKIILFNDYSSINTSDRYYKKKILKNKNFNILYKKK